MVIKEQKQSPQNPNRSPPKHGDGDFVFSPRFRSVAAMAGWDEEALLVASLVVEDTPDRHAKQKKRSDLHFKTPPTSSRRKRRAQRKSPGFIPAVVLNLDEEDDTLKHEITKSREEPKIDEVVAETKENKEESKTAEVVVGTSKTEEHSDSCSKAAAIPCMDRLREELSCAICLEICFEPSTTSCGHSFCKKCLRSAADKCGKRCPKCRQLISNGRSCTVNTVLWNTIQLLFPQEVEARKAAGAQNSREASRDQSPAAIVTRGSRYRSVEALNSPQGDQLNLERRSDRSLRNPSIQDIISTRRRRREREVVPPSQDEDAALAIRLQREEFMEVFRGSEDQPQRRHHHHHHHNRNVTLATANLRAMASRAVNIRVRGRPT